VGIPDLVVDGKTGLLAAPNDAKGLADCLQRMLDDKALAQQFALAGREFVVQKFDLANCLDPLTDRFKAALLQP
jgi:glycosyltransferase involved in cell wall biosynthesis